MSNFHNHFGAHERVPWSECPLQCPSSQGGVGGVIGTEDGVTTSCIFSPPTPFSHARPGLPCHAMPCTRRASGVAAAVMPSLRRGKNGAVEQYLTPRAPLLFGGRDTSWKQTSPLPSSSRTQHDVPDHFSSIRYPYLPENGNPDRVVVAGPSLGPRRTEKWRASRLGRRELSAPELKHSSILSLALTLSASGPSSASLAPPTIPLASITPSPSTQAPTPDTFITPPSPLRNRCHDGH